MRWGGGKRGVWGLEFGMGDAWLRVRVWLFKQTTYSEPSLRYTDILYFMQIQ